MSAASVYHSTRAASKTPSTNCTPRIAHLAASGLSYGAVLTRLILDEHGGFVPKEQLAQILHCSVRQVLRYLGEIKRFRQAQAEVQAAQAEGAVAGPNVTKPTHRQTDSRSLVPHTQVPVRQEEEHEDNNNVVDVHLDPHLQQELQAIAQAWRIPNLERVLPSRLLPAIRASGTYVPGTLTAAFEVANHAWLSRRCYNKVGYLIGVFRQMLPEVFAWINDLKQRLHLIQSIGPKGGLDVAAETRKLLAYWQDLGGAPGVAAQVLCS